MGEITEMQDVYGNKWQLTKGVDYQIATEMNHIPNRDTNIVGNCYYGQYQSCYGAKDMEKDIWNRAMEHCARSIYISLMK